MQKRKYKISNLISLYLNNIFQKPILIVFLISILLMSACVLIASNPWLDSLDYLKSSNDFHLMYFQQGILIIQIFNSVIVSSLVISIVIHSSGFDALFISYIPRRNICIVKLINISFIILILALYEMILFIGVGLFVYPNFYPNLMTFIGFLYLYITMMFEVIISILMTTLFPIVLVPMSILFIFLVLRLICNNYTIIMEYISNFIPLLRLNKDNLDFEMTNPILSVIWILLCFILYINVYSIKDLK